MTLKISLGVFGLAHSDGDMDSVLDALKSYVERHNVIDCSIIYNIICDTMTTSTVVMTAVFTPSPAGYFDPYLDYPTYSPTGSPSVTAGPTAVPPTNSPSVTARPAADETYYPTYLPSVTPRPISSTVLDEGVAAVSDGTVTPPLYSGAYTPTSNVDHM